jgi:hypothetical protein
MSRPVSISEATHGESVISLDDDEEAPAIQQVPITLLISLSRGNMSRLTLS